MKKQRLDNKVADFSLRTGAIAMIVDNGMYSHVFNNGRCVGDVGKVVFVERILQPNEVVNFIGGGYIIGDKRRVTILCRAYGKLDQWHADGEQSVEMTKLGLFLPGQLLTLFDYEYEDEDAFVINKLTSKK